MKLLDRDRRAPGMSWLRLIGWAIGKIPPLLLLSLLYRLRREGRENVPREGPLVYVSNHQSHFDPVIVGLLVLDRPCAFLARDSLFKFKPFGALIRFFNAIPLYRDRNTARALRAAIDELDAGRCVLMFPEGTRTKDGSLGAFRGGFMLLVRRSKASVVPIALDGAHEVWPRSQKLPSWRGRLGVRAGAAIPADELLAVDTDEAVERVRSEIAQLREDVARDIAR